MSLPVSDSSGNHRIMAATFVAVIHILLITFFVLGWCLPWQWAWWTVLGGGISMQAIWCLFANRCPLTLLESYLRTGSFYHKENTDEPSTQTQTEPHFVAGLVSRLTGRQISPYTGNIIAYSTLYSSMFISLMRLLA